MIDHTRLMQEFKLTGLHDAMQLYIGDDVSTVVFFHRERASKDLVPFFVDHCRELHDYGYCVFYADVANAQIERFLADIVL